MDDKKPVPRPAPMPTPTEQRGGGDPDWMWWFSVACIILGAVIVLAMLAGCTPHRARVQAPAWMLTPVPTVDIGIPAIHVWDCMTEPQDVCTEWHEDAE